MPTPCFQHDSYQPSCGDCRDMAGNLFADHMMATTGRGPLTDAEVEAEMNRKVTISGKRPHTVIIDEPFDLPEVDLPPHHGRFNCAGRYVDGPVVNRGRKTEPEGQSGLPRFNPYSIPKAARPGEVACPYCVKRPMGAKGLRDHCRAVHPDKPEAR